MKTFQPKGVPLPLGPRVEPRPPCRPPVPPKPSLDMGEAPPSGTPPSPGSIYVDALHHVLYIAYPSGGDRLVWVRASAYPFEGDGIGGVRVNGALLAPGVDSTVDVSVPVRMSQLVPDALAPYGASSTLLSIIRALGAAVEVPAHPGTLLCDLTPVSPVVTHADVDSAVAAAVGGLVPATRTVNGQPLTGDVVIDVAGSLAGTHYTRAQTDALLAGLVPAARTVNGVALTSDVTLTPADIPGACSTAMLEAALAALRTGARTWLPVATASSAGIAAPDNDSLSVGPLGIMSVSEAWVREVASPGSTSAVAARLAAYGDVADMTADEKDTLLAELLAYVREKEGIQT